MVKNILKLCVAFFVISCAHVQKTNKNWEPNEPSFNTFAVSTEMEIGKAWPIINKAPRGAYISVGAERSFRGYSMYAYPTSLYILDISERVLRFATINRELLRAKDLKTYRNLRFESDFNAWQLLQKNHKVEHILSLDDFAWWQQEVRNVFAADRYTLPEMLNRYETDVIHRDFLKFYEAFKALFKSLGPQEQKEMAKLIIEEPLDKLEKRLAKSGIKAQFSLTELQKWRERYNSGVGCFKTEYIKTPGTALDVASVINFQHGNYLFDKTLYKRLHEAAINKRIYIKLLNLSLHEDLMGFIQHLESVGDRIGLLDLNNTYFKEYIGDPGYMKAIAAFAKLASNDSILLAMSNVQDLGCAQFQSYFGFRYSLLKLLPKDFSWGAYISSLPKNIITHMDQKLYSPEHLPPHFTTWQFMTPRL